MDGWRSADPRNCQLQNSCRIGLAGCLAERHRVSSSTLRSDTYFINLHSLNLLLREDKNRFMFRHELVTIKLHAVNNYVVLRCIGVFYGWPAERELENV